MTSSGSASVGDRSPEIISEQMMDLALQAARCRRLAAASLDEVVKRELIQLASQHDEEAAELFAALKTASSRSATQ